MFNKSWLFLKLRTNLISFLWLDLAFINRQSVLNFIERQRSGQDKRVFSSWCWLICFTAVRVISKSSTRNTTIKRMNLKGKIKLNRLKTKPANSLNTIQLFFLKQKVIMSRRTQQEKVIIGVKQMTMQNIIYHL